MCIITLSSVSEPYQYLVKYLGEKANLDTLSCIDYDQDSCVWGLPLITFDWTFEKEKLQFTHMNIGAPVGTAMGVEWLKQLEIRGCIESIEELLLLAKQYYHKSKPDTVDIYMLHNNWWSLLSRSPKRNIDTIYLPHKNTILTDLKQFLDEEEDYLECGIPWKRNYLFSGPPGVGKTSLVFAMASMLDYGISIINFGPKMDDSVLLTAIAKLDKNKILILEDIDCLFVERKSNDTMKSSVSFSGLLNLLDGVIRRHGLITVMTSNHPERLDDALLRPGRIDKHILFEYMKEPEIKQMFKRIVKIKEDNIMLESKFIKNLGTTEVSPAMLQEFLFRHRNDENMLKHMDEINYHASKELKKNKATDIMFS